MIHVLGEDERDLAARFTRHGSDFRGLELEDGPGGVPLLAKGLARFACRCSARHEGGDHVVLIGEVLDAAYREGSPLVFSQGFYGGFAPHEG